jgi:hypothetical protein
MERLDSVEQRSMANIDASHAIGDTMKAVLAVI